MRTSNKLARYETTANEARKCLIFFKDGSTEQEEVQEGMTFKYAGNDQARKEGRFDRVLWELQMGIYRDCRIRGGPCM